MTQNEALLDYLQKNRCITVNEAVRKLGIASPSKRICEIQAMGYRIHKFTENVKTRYGKARIVLYWYGGKRA